jgi:tetratricopeptide (TPR) repeat protein
MTTDNLGADLEQLQVAAWHMEADQRFELARDAYQQVLRLEPLLQWALEGRARVSMALRETDVAVHCREALSLHDHAPDRQLRMIITVATELGFAALPLLEEFTDRNPTNAMAHQYLAELRAEMGAGGDFAASYLLALRSFPHEAELHFSYWRTLLRSGRSAQALEAMKAAESVFGHDRRYKLLKLDIANQSGLSDLAAGILDELGEQPDTQLYWAHHLLQTGRHPEAAQFIERKLVAQPDDTSAWAMIEPLWRLLNDPRHEWLIGSGRLFGPVDLTLSASELTTIAATLRSLHGDRAPPIGQSVRGGTQTSGELFQRSDPAILRLIEALKDGVRSFVGSLPWADPRHPLLKHRNTGWAFGPSWSIRLTEHGYHAAHFHPGGIMSSASYIAVPDETDASTGQGWLEIGRPPPELGLDLEPLVTIKPQPGRLVLFPSFLFHGTRPFRGEERLTVAFDLVPAIAHHGN